MNLINDFMWRWILLRNNDVRRRRRRHPVPCRDSYVACTLLPRLFVWPFFLCVLLSSLDRLDLYVFFLSFPFEHCSTDLQSAPIHYKKYESFEC